MSKIKAFVFDAYGTLFDVRSVKDRCEEVFPGHGETITIMWRNKQLEYTWLRSLMGRYADFWQVTEEALRFTCQSLRLEHGLGQIDRIMESYLTIKTFPGTVPVLKALGSRYGSLAILSNGTADMLNAAVKNAGLENSFAHVISVDEVKIYKPHPSVYQLAPQYLGIRKEEIGFVSSNGWDVAGARAFGFYTFWLNRTGAAVEELGVRPNAIISGPQELADFIF